MRQLTLELVSIIYKVTKRIPIPFIFNLGERIYSLKDSYVFDVLSTLGVDKGSTYDLTPPDLFLNKIWICWFQGEDKAPDLVKKCIDSVRKHASGYDVIILTEDNI